MKEELDQPRKQKGQASASRTSKRKQSSKFSDEHFSRGGRVPRDRDDPVFYGITVREEEEENSRDEIEMKGANILDGSFVAEASESISTQAILFQGTKIRRERDPEPFRRFRENRFGFPDTDFEGDRESRPCPSTLITSTSDVPEIAETLGNIAQEKKFGSPGKSADKVSVRGKPSRPIFVDLTTDERNSRKRGAAILQQFSEPKMNTADVNVRPDGNFAEHRIMMADSSSKGNCNGNTSLATALRDRGCPIPVQPNRSLPIRPAPSVPTRSFRKECNALPMLTKSSGLDIVHVESVRSLQDRVLHGGPDNRDGFTDETVANLCGTKKNKKNEEEKDGRDVVKDETSTKRKTMKRSEETADSNEDRAESLGCTMKDFFMGESQDTGVGETDNGIVSVSKGEMSNKVPPLRLKKIARIGTKNRGKFQPSEGTVHESNYRIVADVSRRASTIAGTDAEGNEATRKDAQKRTVTTNSSDTYKLKCRRNRLKRKLRELRGKALELAKEMAENSSSQKSTRLRQVMNRYEKQIENLSKLHSKLTAALPVAKRTMDANEDFLLPTDDNYSPTNESLPGSRSPVLSPEPPKLSPLSFGDIVDEEIQESPPILARVCEAISSSQESVDDEPRIEQKIWTVNEESADSINKVSSEADKGEQDAERVHDNVRLKLDAFQLAIGSGSPSSEKSEGFAVPESEKIGIESGPVISSVCSGLEVAQSDPEDGAFEILSVGKVDKGGHDVQKVTSSSGHPSQFDALDDSGLRRENLTSQQDCKRDEIPMESVQKNAAGQPLTEQFPSLGNWLAQMSKKHSSKSKSKFQTTTNVPFVATETNAACISGREPPKVVHHNASSDVINATPQCNTESCQFHHHQHQQQRQQFVQHVGATMTLPQPVAVAPPLRPGICSAIPMSQFYPNNYAIDPYNGATLSYHPTLCPYGSYAPCHSRLHPSNSFPSYHYPMHDPMRSMQHMDKRFPLIQDAILRYPPPPSTSTLQHSGNLEFDRNPSKSNAVLSPATCLSPLFLPPPTLSPSHQTLPRPPLLGYPNSQFHNRNRMIPDVVAAAAAAAVVAAASFDRQRDNLTYNKSSASVLPAAGIASVIDGEKLHEPGSSKTEPGRQNSNDQTPDSNFKGEGHENAKYQQVQNYLYDRLGLVRTPRNFAQMNAAAGVHGNRDTLSAPIHSPTSYRMPLIAPHTQLSKKNEARNELRNCETPHLGMMNRNPNSLHDFTCSNCGAVGPKFECLGCEMAFYCNERCQEKHWYVHVQKCPKKMPKLKKVT